MADDLTVNPMRHGASTATTDPATEPSVASQDVASSGAAAAAAGVGAGAGAGSTAAAAAPDDVVVTSPGDDHAAGPQSPVTSGAGSLQRFERKMLGVSKDGSRRRGSLFALNIGGSSSDSSTDSGSDREGNDAAATSRRRRRRVRQHQHKQCCGLRGCCNRIRRSLWFNVLVIVCIIANSIVLGVETNRIEIGARKFVSNVPFYITECVFLAVFCFEMAVKLVAKHCAFFNRWNSFDFTIVLVSVIDAWIIVPIVHSTGSVTAVPQIASVFVIARIARVLRVTRILRLTSYFQELHNVWEAFFNSFSSMLWLLVLLVMWLYMTSVMATRLIGKNDVYLTASAEERENIDLWFGSVGRSLYTLFQVLTLESWSMGIARPVLKYQPFMWIFFVLYVAFTTLFLLNLVTGIVVDKTLNASRLQEAQAVRDRRKRVLPLLGEMESVFERFDEDQSGTLSLNEMVKAFQSHHMRRLLRRGGYPPMGRDVIEGLYKAMDADMSNDVSFVEFVSGLLESTEPVSKVDILALAAHTLRAGRRAEVAEEAASKCQQYLEQIAAALNVDLSAQAPQHSQPFTANHTRRRRRVSLSNAFAGNFASDKNLEAAARPSLKRPAASTAPTGRPASLPEEGH